MAALETRTIEEVTETLIDYRGKTPTKDESGVRLVTAKVIKDGFIQEERSEYISEETYSTWMRRGYPQQFDIVLTTEAPLGEVAQLRTKERIALAQRVILLRGNPNIIDQQFFFQAIKSPFVQAGLQQRATGTTVLGIKQSELRQVNVPYYPLPTQRKIAAILSAYDELIENNLHRIKILEEMAQNLYREWFVKFRFPGQQRARFTDSPFGRIPNGWEVGRLDNALILQRGFDLPTKKRHDGVVPIFASTGVVGNHDEAKVKAPGVVTGRSGSLGTVLFVDEDFWPLNTTLWVKQFKTVTPIYAYYLLSALELGQFNAGAAVPTLNRNDIHGLPVVIPPSDILQKFDEQVLSIHRLIKNFKYRNTNLRRTRDLLLPRLISGKVDVSELDIAVHGEAVA